MQRMDCNHLKLAPDKAEALYFTGPRGTREVNLVVVSHPIDFREEARYLGAYLDSGLTGTAHLNRVSASFRGSA